MRIATWNVNSVRVRIAHVTEWLAEHTPSVLCLQETKVHDLQFPLDAFTDKGYHSSLNGQKTYNGVSIHSREPLSGVRAGFPDESMNEQKRVISGIYRGISIVNVYVPQGESVESDKFAFKLKFLRHLVEYVGLLLRDHREIVLVGDFNIACDDRDIYAPDLYRGHVMFHPAEHEALAELSALGMHDALRLVSAEPGIYSWWDYRNGSFWKNNGIRLDHIWVSTALKDRVESVTMGREERKRTQPSDHVPVVLSLRE